MKFSFGLKLGIVISVLSVSLTGLCVYYFYTTTYQMTIKQMGKNLRDVGNVGALLFDHETREALKRVKQQALVAAKLDRKLMEALPVGGVHRSISVEAVKRIHASGDFQLLVRKLKMIAHASYKDSEPLLDDYEIEPVAGYDNGMVGTYIAIELGAGFPRDIGMYLVSAAPEPTSDGWPGNPIGTLFRSYVPFSEFQQKIFVLYDLITDDFYQSLSSTVPLFDENRETIAVLGLDYAAGRELNKLTRLGWLCAGLIAVSFVLSVLLSVVISRRMNAPLRQMHDAAGRVGNGDLDADVQINSSDEFGLLGRTFNLMLGNIRRAMRKLEDKNRQLAAVISDMHDGVGSILTSIALISGQNSKQSDTQLTPINRLSQQGLAEVRFLMNALDYDKCDSGLILNEVENLAADILVPAKVRFDLKIHGDPPQHEIPFADFLNLQRVFREAFTNILKHSAADHCLIQFSFSASNCGILIRDNGDGGKAIAQTSGRGLDSMQARIKGLGGTVQYVADTGFAIRIDLPFAVLE